MLRLIIMGGFIALIAIAILVAVTAKKHTSPYGNDRTEAAAIRRGAFGLAAFATACILLMCTVVIPPRTVGVKVAFGKPVGAIGNGLHTKAPWTSVEKLDGSVQNDVYNGDSTITVRLGNNSRAEADVSIQWRMLTDNAEKLFLDYKTFDSIRSNLVDRNLRATLNDVMADYNPLSTVAASKDSTAGVDLEGMGNAVQKRLQAKLGSDIDVISVTIPIVKFDDSTQAKIDELQAEIARTRVAEQKQQTAEAERRANEILDRSVSDNVLTSKCLDIVDRSGKSPLGCFPGASGQPVVQN